MYSKGEMVVCGYNGVCIIKDISKLDGMDVHELYYIMQPIYEKNSTVYIPVSSEEKSMRRVMTHEEAESFIKDMPNVEPAVVEVERQRENYYRTYMDKAVCSSWVALIKYLYKRNNERIAAGKKIISLDERYMRMAQNCLHGELAAALEVPREQVDSIIQQILDDGE